MNSINYLFILLFLGISSFFQLSAKREDLLSLNIRFDSLRVFEPSHNTKNIAQQYFISNYIYNSQQYSYPEFHVYRDFPFDMNIITKFNFSEVKTLVIYHNSSRTNNDVTTTTIHFDKKGLITTVERGGTYYRERVEIQYENDIPIKILKDDRAYNFYAKNNYILETKDLEDEGDGIYENNHTKPINQAFYYETDSTLQLIERSMWWHDGFAVAINDFDKENQTLTCTYTRPGNGGEIDTYSYRYTNRGKIPFSIIDIEKKKKRSSNYQYNVARKKNIITITINKISYRGRNYDEVYLIPVGYYEIVLDGRDNIMSIEKSKNNDTYTETASWKFEYIYFEEKEGMSTD